MNNIYKSSHRNIYKITFLFDNYLELERYYEAETERDALDKFFDEDKGLGTYKSIERIYVR